MEKIPGALRQSERVEKLAFEHSPESYKQVIFWSFLLSQGNPQTQKEIFNYVTSHSKPFDAVMYEEAQKRFAETYFEKNQLELSEQIRKFHVPIEYESTTMEYDAGWVRDHDTSTPLKVLKYQLGYLDTQPTHEGKPANLRDFANQVWSSDLMYFRNGGRPNRSEEKTGSDTLNDQWFSFGISYLMRDKKTSVDLLNQMLEEASRVDPFSGVEERSGKIKSFTTDDLYYILTTYNKMHPDTPVSNEEIHSYMMQLSNENTK